MIFPRLFNADQIVGLFDNTDNRLIAGRVIAITTRINIGQIIANRAKRDLLFDLADGFNQAVGAIPALYRPYLRCAAKFKLFCRISINVLAVHLCSI